MRISRRNFIGFTTIFAGVGGWFFSLVDNKPNESIKSEYTSILTSYLDTLIPEHGEFISASKADVVTELLNKENTNKEYSQILNSGCAWLESVSLNNYQKKFVSLSEEQRIKIITQAESAWRNKPSTKNIPGYFFNVTRRDGYSFYYQNPMTWKALNYNGPPQPNGFPDYES